MSARANSRQEKAGAQPGNFSATITKHKVDFATDPRIEKAFSSWQAKFAMHGHTLYRPASADGAIRYLAARWGMIRELPTLDAIAKFYAQIGGKV